MCGSMTPDVTGREVRNADDAGGNRVVLPAAGRPETTRVRRGVRPPAADGKEESYRGLAAVIAPERNEHHIRPLLHAGVAAVAKVALSDEDADQLATSRLVTRHRSPPRVVVPVDPDLRGLAARFELAPIP